MAAYHDVRLTNYSAVYLRIWIMPNAWLCTRIYGRDAHVVKNSVFVFPRLERLLSDQSVTYELLEWNNKVLNYDMLSIGMVLAELYGSEQRLRNLHELHVEGRMERVLACLPKA
jgi:hypothetical protein